jgi:hypothetical protein
MFGGCDTRLCTPPFQESADRPGFTGPGSVHQRPGRLSTWLLLAVSCIRRVRSRRVGSKLRPSGFTALMVVPRTGWARSSRARGPLARPTWTWFLPDEFRRRDACASPGRRGRDRTPIYAFLRVRQKASRGQNACATPERQTPCGATRWVRQGISPLGTRSPKRPPYLYAPVARFLGGPGA